LAEIKQIRAIKGVRDILPPESAAWNRVERAAHEVFAGFGYGEIRLPILEDSTLFDRSVGSETDIVAKEMYRIESSVELMRRILVGETVWPMFKLDPSQYQRFTGVLSSFLVVAKMALESGEIPSNKENSSAIQKLDEVFQLALRSNPEKLPNEESIRQGIRKDVETIASQFVLENPCMRPEATASVCRAYIEHGMQTLPGNVKLYYVGPMFRRERPQKGRYRQFYQIGAEVLGQSDAPGIDAELIEMLIAFFAKVGLESAALQINSIGDKACRPKYIELLRGELVKVKDKLGADSQRRIETNPLRVLDSKLPEEQAIIEKLPRISEHLCADCRDHFAEVRRQLDLRGIAYEQNWRLVRGLDYYMRTTFEITAPGLGSQNAVCGGGRYDGLVELLGGPPTKGIGFAIGEDRLMLSLESAGKAIPEAAVDAFIVWMGASAQAAAIKLARVLREAGVKVEVPAVEMKFGKALGLADKLRAKHAIIIGENEIAAGKFTVKRLADAVQKSLSEAELVAELEWK
jgi:histidyl-tRNA synthetase